MVVSLLMSVTLALSPSISSSSGVATLRLTRHSSSPSMSCVEEFGISKEIKRVFVHDGPFASELADEVVAAAALAIEQKGSFAIAVPSGSVVDALGSLGADAIDWTKTHIFFANEFCDENRNRAAVLEACPHAVPAQVHTVGIGAAAEIATAYAAALGAHPAIDNSGPLPSLDMILLGTGGDGHCGMLFPDSPEIKATGQGLSVVAVEGKAAVALTMDVMSAAKYVLVSAAGAGRAEMVSKALSGEFGQYDCPAGMVEAQIETLWFVDEESMTDFSAVADELMEEDV